MNRAFVTGATGIIGYWLVRRLVGEDVDVIALVRDIDPLSELYRSGLDQKVRVVNGPVEDFKTITRALARYEPDTVFHLAAQSLVTVAERAPRQTFESNIRGTYNILEACRSYQEIVETVVVASSDKAYGESDNLPYKESMALDGVHPYEVSKGAADLLAQSYAEMYGLPVAISRCCNVYGGADLNWSRIVPGTVRSLLTGERPVIRSDGTQIREYMYVKDVVGAYVTLADYVERGGRGGQAFNFSSERPLTVLEMVDEIASVLGREDVDPIILGEAENEIPAQSLSCEKAASMLNWKPSYTMAEGLSETIDWYRRFLADAG